MKKTKNLSMVDVFKSSFSPGSSGRKAAMEYKSNKNKNNIETVFENIKDCLAKGEKVRVANFGTFGTRKRATRMAKNPRTGKKISVKAMNTPFFIADKKFKEKIK